MSPDLATITGRGTKRGTELMLLAFAVAVSLTVGAGSFHGGDVSALLASRGDRTAIGIIVGAAAVSYTHLTLPTICRV